MFFWTRFFSFLSLSFIRSSQSLVLDKNISPGLKRKSFENVSSKYGAAHSSLRPLLNHFDLIPASLRRFVAVRPLNKKTLGSIRRDRIETRAFACKTIDRQLFRLLFAASCRSRAGQCRLKVAVNLHLFVLNKTRFSDTLQNSLFPERVQTAIKT
jgi:hypothetical protein